MDELEDGLGTNEALVGTTVGCCCWSLGGTGGSREDLGGAGGGKAGGPDLWSWLVFSLDFCFPFPFFPFPFLPMVTRAENRHIKKRKIKRNLFRNLPN